MYKRHKRLLGVAFIGTFGISFYLKLDFSPIAETAITVASIAMGVYIAAVSALLGSGYAKELKTTTDRECKSKTLLGVLSDYFRIAGLFCIVLIIIGCLYLIPATWSEIDSVRSILFRCGNSLSYAVFSANILFLWLILTFLINSLGKSVKG